MLLESRSPALTAPRVVQRVEVDAKEVRIMGRKACSCARSSLPQARKRRILECLVL